MGKIRLYLDEDVMDSDLIDALRARAVDLTTVCEAGMEGRGARWKGEGRREKGEWGGESAEGGSAFRGLEPTATGFWSPRDPGLAAAWAVRGEQRPTYWQANDRTALTAADVDLVLAKWE